MLLTTHEAATYLRLARPTLERFRLTGGGPAFCKMGGKAVRYRQEDLDNWLESCVRKSTSDEGDA